MSYSAYDTLLFLLGLLLETGLPFIILLSAFIPMVVEIRNRQQGDKLAKSSRFLVIACSILWIFLYAEHYSHGSVSVFDVGAPLVTLISALLLPVLVPVSIRIEAKAVHSCRSYYLVASLSALGAISIVPGIHMAWYYYAAIVSGS